MKISVVMATCNGEKYLDQQIQSILKQSLKPDEFIVCDDVSTDDTVAILKKYQEQGQLIYVVNDHRLGFVDNFKKAVGLAANDNYVALCDQDDEWLPDKLEKSIVLLEKINDNKFPCMVYSDLILIDQNGNILNNSFRNELGQDKYQHNLETLLFGSFVTGCTAVMNPELKRLFADFPNNVQLNHDGWMTLMAFTFGKAESTISPLVRYRKHGNNASIPADTKPRNRYRSTVNEILKAINGKDDFLSAQLETVRKFYDRYKAEMTIEKKGHFEKFLRLEHKSYPFKKLAFRRVVKKFRAH